jgi:hypothetical protein
MLFRAVVLLLAGLPLAAIILLAMCFQDRPLVTGVASPTPKDIERAKRVVDAQTRNQHGLGEKIVTIDEEDLVVALNYAASRIAQASARVRLQSGVARLQASLQPPANPFGRYVNIDAELHESEAAPQIHRLQIGALPVPVLVADFLFREGLRRLLTTDRTQVVTSVVKSVHFGDGTLTVNYRSSDDIAAMARSVLVAPEDQRRLRAYQERLAEVVARAPRSLSVAALMPPLFQLAVERGASAGQVRENRAVIVVLAFYAIEKPLDRIVPAATNWAQPARRAVTLAGRTDLPKHFLVSAAIAAEAGSPLADAIGVYKEVADSRGGSGFSFNDIGADRAGTRFGEVASESPARARELARSIAAGVEESDFMPDVADLPEHMPEAEFKRRYGGVDGAGYRQMMATIEQRVAARPLLRR